MAVSGITNAVSVTADTPIPAPSSRPGRRAVGGRNDRGQLGNNSTADSATPVKPTLGLVDSVTAGVFHTCALLDDASLWCWGANDYGQVGDSSTMTA